MSEYAEATASGLPWSCLMRCDAWLRSHNPMSQRPVKPQSRSWSSSSSGMPSSVRMARPYLRDSWSSQT